MCIELFVPTRFISHIKKKWQHEIVNTWMRIFFFKFKYILIEICQRYTMCAWARTHSHSKANGTTTNRCLPLTLQCAFIIVFIANFIQVGNQLFECFTIDDQTSYTIFWIANNIGRTQVITNVYTWGKKEKEINRLSLMIGRAHWSLSLQIGQSKEFKIQK